MDELTDEQLVELYLKGQKQALEILIKRYLTPIFNFVLRYAKETAAAEDITQEVFIKVWKKIKQFDDHYKFKNWLYTIAKNTSLDYLKKNRTINFSQLDLAGSDLLFEELVKENTSSPQAELALAQDAASVQAMVDKLPPKYQETIKLRYQEGYKFREIAAILKKSAETIKSRNRRALIYLRKLIGK